MARQLISETAGVLLLTEDLVKTSADLEILGNLTVQGDTTTVNVGTLVVEDKDIQVNKGGTTAGTDNAGLEILGTEVAGVQPVVGYMRVAGNTANLEFKAPGNASVLTLDIDATETITVGGSLNIEADSAINQDLTTNAAVTFASVTANGGVTVDDLTLDGTSLALSSGTLALDSAGNIELNADGGTLTFADGAISLLSFTNSGSDVIVKPLATVNNDVIFHSAAEIATEIFRIDSSAESLLMASSKKIQLGAAEEAIYGDGTDIHFEVGAGGDINLPVNIGLTFGADEEKIEGNGTDLTIASGVDINLSAASDINIPSAVGLKFGTDAQGNRSRCKLRSYSYSRQRLNLNTYSRCCSIRCS